MSIYDTLNDRQQEAVFYTEGPLLILAGAGSGKTRVLTHRIAWLIDQIGVNPWNILAITFTNKAAGEMRERVDQIVGFGSESIWVSTFHSMCVRILRRYIDRLGYDTNFTIYDADDQKTLIKDVCKYLQIDTKMFKERSLLSAISSAKDELVTPEEMTLRAEGDWAKKKIAQVYTEYEKQLKANNALDFDDLLLKTVQLLQTQPDVLEYYQERFRYIMVDEYQDTNTVQFKLVSLLAGKYQNLCVVGDDDQSIYKFRGANIMNILNFEKEYPNVTIKYESGVMKDDYSEWLSQKALKGDLPDVFMVLPEDFSIFSSVGMLKNLDSYTKIDKAFKKSNYYEGSYDAGTYKGTQYALPYESVPTLMLVNKTLLKKEHIKMPGNHWTWDDFYKICQKVTKDTDGDGRLDQFGVYNYKWNDATLSNGGTLFNQSGTKCNLSSEPIENAILFTKKIEKISSFRNLTSDDFDSGNIAFRPMTFSEFRTYKPYPWKINKYFDFKWDCIRLPSGPDGENKTQVDNLLMGISNQTKQGDMAWQFLKKLCYETKTQQKIFQYRQGISPLKAVTNSKQAQQVLEKSMGENMTDKMKLLDELMNNALQIPKFRRYNEAYQKIDSEMTRILTDEEEFDSNILKLKQEIDKFLNQ